MQFKSKAIPPDHTSIMNDQVMAAEKDAAAVGARERIDDLKKYPKSNRAIDLHRQVFKRQAGGAA